MVVRYVRSDQLKLAVIAISGPFDPDEFFKCVEHHRSEGGWPYGVLYDLRSMSDPPANEALLELADIIAWRPGAEPCGPVALLTHAPVSFTEMTKRHRVIRVFPDEEEAEAWLSQYRGRA